MERPNATLCNGKHSVLNNLCYTAFSAYCTLENKSSKTCKYQTDEFDDYLIENNCDECSYPQKLNW